MAPGGVQQVEPERRLADLEDVQQPTWQGGLGPLGDASGGTGELAQVHAVELLADLGPGVAGSGLGHPHQHQRQKAEGDVGADPLSRSLTFYLHRDRLISSTPSPAW